MNGRCRWYDDCIMRRQVGCEVADCEDYQRILESAEHTRLLAGYYKKDKRPTRIRLDEMGGGWREKRMNKRLILFKNDKVYKGA
jgi:hypothetical protein